MWIESRPNGTYKACERYIDPLTGKTKRVAITIASTSKQAQKDALRTLNDKIEKALMCQEKKQELNLEELKDRYIEWQKASGIQENTWRRNETIITSVLKILGSDTLVNKLTARYIMVQMTSKDISNTKRNTYMTRFKAMLRWGYRNDYIDSIEYLDKISRFPDESAREKVVDKYLESDEIVKLLEGMKNERWNLLTRFLILSGLRIGEAMALEKSDVTDEHIIVAKTYDLTNGYIKNRTKTESSTRNVDIQDELKDVIRQLKVFSLKQQLKHGYKTDLIISGEDGGPINYPTYAKYIREVSERTIGRRITPHALRHTHVSLLAAKGMSLDAIARRVGHEDSSITRKIYFHITNELAKNDRKAIMEIKLLS